MGATNGKPLVASAEVLDVIINTAHPEYKDKDDIGKIFANIFSTLGNTTAGASWYKPLHTNIHTFPLIGELVLLTQAPALKSQETALKSTYYWISTIGMAGNRNSNAMENASFYSTDYVNDAKGETFEDIEVEHLESFEGDTIIQGQQDQYYHTCLRCLCIWVNLK